MKRIFFLFSILLCSLTMTAQSAWMFNRGDSISWQPTQDMTVTFEKDPAGFFWQNIKTGNLDIIRMPIETGDGIMFADTPFLQVEKKNIEVTNEGNRQFEVRLKTNISDWSSILCQPQADWLRLIEVNESQFPVITYTFEYDAKYTGYTVEIKFINNQFNLSDNVYVSEILTEREALMGLYYATNGDNWTNSTNWGSDKPLSEWYGCQIDEDGMICSLQLPSNNLTGVIPNSLSALKHLKDLNLSCNSISGEIPSSIGTIPSLENINLTENFLTGTIPQSICLLPNIYSFDAQENLLSGEIPEYLANLMDKVRDITHLNIRYNDFSGKVPDKVVNHPRFKELWPLILDQKGDIDISDISFSAPDFKVVDIDGNIINSEELYKKNKLTLLYNWESWCPYSAAFNEKLIPAYNQLWEKGFDIVGLSTLCGVALPCDDEDTYRKYIEDKGIHWRNVSQIPEDNWVSILYACASPQTVLVDNKGMIISQSLIKEGEGYNQIIPRLEEYFGESIKYDYYISTDYSQDGKILKLQTATEGDGIDLVFMGEAFVDKDMEEGGKYEQKMNEAMEQFFSIEPYTSLRSRFNVYAVKVVSPHAEFASDAKHAINESNEKAFEYAKKALGDNAKRMMVGVVYNTGVSIDRSYTTMYEGDGSFVAYMMDGVSNVLNHEMGGHGIAFLLDEYVEKGMEDQSPNEEAKAALDAAFANYGEGANIDWRNDPSEVKWAHLLKDSRYADEGLGVYEGAWLYGHGAYRPTLNSMMRHNDCGFNAPSREAIYKRVMKLSESDSWSYDYEKFVEFDTPARESYRKQQSAARRAQGQNVKKRRIESRPPTIYKGTWRDAGKCEKVDYSDFNN